MQRSSEQKQSRFHSFSCATCKAIFKLNKMVPAEKMFVDRTDDIMELEKDQKNKWQWRWLEDPDSHGDYFSTYVRKLREPGK